MKAQTWVLALLTTALGTPSVSWGQSMPGMPDMTPPAGAESPKPGTQKAPSQKVDMPGQGGAMPGMMKMPSTTDLTEPMSKEGSGTSWLPASSPMYGQMTMRGKDTLMVHGVIAPRYVDVGSRRGDRRFDAPSWLMGMDTHPLGNGAQLGTSVMLSLDPILEGGYGYPLLFQTGETWHNQPLHDRQHPHDLVSELAAVYSRKFSGNRSGYLYLGYPGEPALGPPTFMHRLLAYDYMPAPIGHHWQDATHILFGVATLGMNFGGKVKVEGSDFTGRDPDENRYSFDRPRFDSYSGRLSYNPDSDNAFQVSYGYIRNPDGDGTDQHRVTGSWLYNRPLGEDANFTTALIFGQNDETGGGGKTDSYLAEADYQVGANAFFGRAENIRKSALDLALAAPFDPRRKFRIGAYTAGYVRDLTHGKGIDTGLGFAVTANTKPSGLDSVYGTGTPVSFEVFFRIRPSRMKMSDMNGMTMGTQPGTGAGSMPGMGMGH